MVPTKSLPTDWYSAQFQGPPTRRPRQPSKRNEPAPRSAACVCSSTWCAVRASTPLEEGATDAGGGAGFPESDPSQPTSSRPAASAVVATLPDLIIILAPPI